MPTDTTGLVVVAVSWIVSALLAVPLWRKPGGAAGKVAWTALLAAPVVGPVAFAILHDPPAPKAGCGCGSSCQEDGALTKLGRGDAAEGQGDGEAR
jgi:hypothetical protein